MSDTAVTFDRFHHVPVLIEVELGSIAMDLENILRLRDGDVLHIGEPVGIPLRVLAGGVELGSADLVTVDQQVSARITRISQAQTPGGHGGDT